MKFLVFFLFGFLTLWGQKIVYNNTTLPCLAYLANDTKFDGNFGEVYGIDFLSGEKVPFSKAIFILNSRKESTCSKHPIYIFASSSNATNFQKRYGGDQREGDFAFFVAQKDLEFDKQIIDNRHKQSILRGKEIFYKTCKSNLANCTNLSTKNRNDLMLFLHNQNHSALLSNVASLSVPSGAKCPVCGMFVEKYPKWAAKLQTIKHESFYFDGIKDMMKFYFNPKAYYQEYKSSDFGEILVSDYYSTSQINAKNAFFVVGSNVFGPMGHELIAFAKEEEAKEFSNSHYGKKIYSFEQLNLKIIQELDRGVF